MIMENHESEFSLLEETLEESSFKLLLYNDDVNTFTWVIDCLIKYCKHSQEQAEQCAWLVHYKGKALVKSGDFTELKPICETLCEKGLDAKIED
jgi:ATP-dependent Clp protease adaptor protein ClpS